MYQRKIESLSSNHLTFYSSMPSVIEHENSTTTLDAFLNKTNSA